jgi:hypothetical protein
MQLKKGRDSKRCDKAEDEVKDSAVRVHNSVPLPKNTWMLEV